jgi:hypothetical protein
MPSVLIWASARVTQGEVKNHFRLMHMYGGIFVFAPQGELSKVVGSDYVSK